MQTTVETNISANLLRDNNGLGIDLLVSAGYRGQRIRISQNTLVGGDMIAVNAPGITNLNLEQSGNQSF